MAWQSLSQRTGKTEADGPYEGMPAHVYKSIVYWFQGLAGYRSHHFDTGRLQELRTRLRQSLGGNFGETIMERLLSLAAQNQDFALDLVDAALDVWGEGANRWQELDKFLAAGASAWKVADDHVSLTRVVSDEAQATFESAVSVEDAPTTELREAWANAFGRNGDPSDAWDHAIKAVEDVLIPVVVPNKAKATMGDVLGQLGSSSTAAKWKMVLPGNDQTHDVAPLVAMLRLMWPNHDRHGGNLPKRTPSIEEARAVVTLAATIVQWHRDGWVVQKR
jgi:hypothetical protein